MIVNILIIFIFLALSGCFSGSESALFSLPWWKIQQYQQDSRPSRRLIARVLENPRKLLITLLIGNTLVNTAASSLAENTLETMFPGDGLWIAIIVMTLVLLIAGEVTPKILAMNWPETISVGAAYLVRRVNVILTPFRIVIEYLVSLLFPSAHPEELSENSFKTQFIGLVDESVRGNVLTSHEREVIHRIFKMEHQLVSQIMTPRIQIFGLPETVSGDEAAQALFEHDLRRVPLFRDSLDTITGILYAKDLLASRNSLHARQTPRKLTRPPYFVPATMTTRQLYQELKKNRRHLAIVLDEYGGTSGLVTLDDILRMVFKPVTHPDYLTTPETNHKPHTIQVPWDIEQDDLRRIGVTLDADFRTLNGYLIDRFGHVPRPGQSLTVDGWTMTILESSGTRITTVEISPVQSESGA